MGQKKVTVVKKGNLFEGQKGTVIKKDETPSYPNQVVFPSGDKAWFADDELEES